VVMNPICPETLAGQIAAQAYLRERLSPAHGDMFYVHLYDILCFLKSLPLADFESVLDYGCGGSPYRTLFNAKKYIRADYINSDGIDIKIGLDAKLNCANETFDAVLSTQVLEHAQDPQAYLNEAFRVLKPGGKLILTTHGIWEDHGCPYDFRRWTADGLKQEIADAGFCVAKTMKLTTGPRAILFMFGRMLGGLTYSRKTKFGWIFWLIRQSSLGRDKQRDAFLDKRYGHCVMVPDDMPGHGTYMAIGCIAEKSSDTR